MHLFFSTPIWTFKLNSYKERLEELLKMLDEQPFPGCNKYKNDLILGEKKEKSKHKN